ncbi:MAG: prepilin peptidase, partial [Bdellovibrionota bacterium]
MIYRLPLGKSVVKPGSACMACGKPVRWYNNVP